MSNLPANGRRFTYADYVTWPADERWEIIDGVRYNMTPTPPTVHQLVLGELMGQIHTQVRGCKCKALLGPLDVLLPEADEDLDHSSTVVQPDFLVVCDCDKLHDHACIGAPDFVLEVIAPHTASKDQTKKVASYERHGVREYWAYIHVMRS